MQAETAETTGVVESPGALISVKSLWKVFGKNAGQIHAPENEGKSKAKLLADLGCVVALQDVSFDVNRGETFVVMGLSGSGKSTLIRCITRLLEPTSGSIRIGGSDIINMTDKELTGFRRSKVAMVFQQHGLMPHRNVLDNAAWGLEVQGMDKPSRYARVREVLELVGLAGWERSYPRQLSGGMQQRVGLARALAVETDILLMDEPFSGLDPLIRRQMQDELLRIESELHKTIIFITHDLNEAVKMGDRIAILRDGKVAQMGSPEDIVLRPEDQYVGDFTQDVRAETILTAAKVMTSPKAIVMGHQAPRAALHTIGQADGNAAWVVDGRERYIGLLSISKAREALRAGVNRIDQAWYYVDREYNSVPSSATFDELIPLAMASDYPIPIVDGNNVLIGEVYRSGMAEAIAETSPADPDYAANAAENSAAQAGN